jgi:hypothetical protein
MERLLTREIHSITNLHRFQKQNKAVIVNPKIPLQDYLKNVLTIYKRTPGEIIISGWKLLFECGAENFVAFDKKLKELWMLSCLLRV